MSTHIFQSKTQYLAIILQRHKKTSAFRLIYNIIETSETKCFSFSFCQRNISQDTVSNYSKITMLKNYIKKNYAEFGKFIYLRKKEKNRKRISRAAVGCPE